MRSLRMIQVTGWGLEAAKRGVSATTINALTQLAIDLEQATAAPSVGKLGVETEVTDYSERIACIVKAVGLTPIKEITGAEITAIWAEICYLMTGSQGRLSSYF